MKPCPSQANNLRSAFEAVTTGPGQKRIAVCSFTRGQLGDTVTNVFIKHVANGTSPTV